ncbi:WD repeat-containing protein 76, partial [Phenoliferia sp. Uapishka_3]
MGLDTAKDGLAIHAPPPPPPRDRSKKRSAPAGPPLEGTRKSARSSGIIQSPEEIETIRIAEQEELNWLIAQAQIAKHAPRPIEALRGVLGSGSTQSLYKTLASVAAEEQPAKPRPNTSPRKPKGREVPRPLVNEPEDHEGEDELRESLEKLVLRDLVKVVPERIYCLLVHPSETKDIVIIGDKKGHVGIWDATHAGEKPSVANGAIRATGGVDQDEDMVDGQATFWHWKAHSGTISSLRFPPLGTAGGISKLYSSSYDCTVRVTDLHTGTSSEVIDADKLDDAEPLVHNVDFTQDGNEIWGEQKRHLFSEKYFEQASSFTACDNNGGIIFRDLREPMETTRRWQVEKYKIGCISLNPVDRFTAVTAHLKREMRIWDLRKLLGMPTGSPIETYDECVVARYGYEKACTSAYFDQTGTRILSTSYDDTIRVWDDLDSTNFAALNEEGAFEPSQLIHHDVQTGRYCSVFKATWVTSPATVPIFTIGDMQRVLDVVASTTGTRLAGLTGEIITSVPAATAAHPITPGKYYGGTAAGKVSFYSNPVE